MSFISFTFKVFIICLASQSSKKLPGISAMDHIEMPVAAQFDQTIKAKIAMGIKKEYTILH